MPVLPVLRQHPKEVHRLQFQLRDLFGLQLLHDLRQRSHHSPRRSLLELPLPLFHLRRHRRLHHLPQRLLLLPRRMPDRLSPRRQPRQRSLSMCLRHCLKRSVRYQLRLRLHLNRRFMPTLQLQLRAMFRQHQQVHSLYLRLLHRRNHCHLRLKHPMPLRPVGQQRSLHLDL